MPQMSVSVGKAVDMLQDHGFCELKHALCSSQLDFRCFWTLVRNLSLTTDASNRAQLKWERAFGRTTDASRQHLAPSERILPMLEHVVFVVKNAHFMHHWDHYFSKKKLLQSEKQKLYLMGHLPSNRVLERRPNESLRLFFYTTCS